LKPLSQKAEGAYSDCVGCEIRCGQYHHYRIAGIEEGTRRSMAEATRGDWQ